MESMESMESMGSDSFDSEPLDKGGDRNSACLKADSSRKRATRSLRAVAL